MSRNETESRHSMPWISHRRCHMLRRPEKTYKEPPIPCLMDSFSSEHRLEQLKQPRCFHHLFSSNKHQRRTHLIDQNLLLSNFGYPPTNLQAMAPTQPNSNHPFPKTTPSTITTIKTLAEGVTPTNSMHERMVNVKEPFCEHCKQNG